MGMGVVKTSGWVHIRQGAAAFGWGRPRRWVPSVRYSAFCSAANHRTSFSFTYHPDFFSSPSSSLCFQLSLFCKISQVILQHTHAHCGSYLFCVFSVILTGMHHFNNRGLFIFSLPRFFPFVLGQQLPWRCLFWCPTDDYHHKHLGRSAHASCLLSVVNSCRCGMDA